MLSTRPCSGAEIVLLGNSYVPDLAISYQIAGGDVWNSHLNLVDL
jgi:hypothetical protein